jgi:hypothetical protein
MKRQNNRKRRFKARKTKHTRSRKSPRKIRITRKINVPRTAKQFSKLSAQAQERWIRITQAVSKMRADRVSLQEASREFDIDPRVVTRLGKSALRKRKNGKYGARRADKLLRILVVPAADEKDGKREIAIRDSRQASFLGKYWAGVQKYLQTGDASGLKNLRRKYVIDASGRRVRLLMDLAELDRRGFAGELSFETFYAKKG